MLKHTRQYVAEKILSIEQNHDVLSYQIDGIHLWPLIRYNLCALLADQVFPDSIVDFSRAFSLVKSNLNDEFTSKNNEIELDITSIESNNKRLSCDYLFLDKASDLNLKSNRRRYSSISAAFGILKDQKKCTLIELLEPASFSRQPRLHDPYYLNFPHYSDYNSFKKNKQKFYKIPKLYCVNEFLNIVCEELKLDYLTMIDDIEAQISYQISILPHAIKILEILKPDFVFQRGFSPFTISPAVNIACTALNITSIEIQNGLIGPFEWPHTHLAKYPKSGFEMLSDYLWVWDKETKEQIKASCGQDMASQIPINCGIPRAY